MKNIRIKRAGTALLVALSIFSFTACSSQQTASTTDKTTSQQTTAGQTTVYGKVTAVDGSKITLALGTLNAGGGRQRNSFGNGQQGTASNGIQQGSRPAGNKNNASGSTGNGTQNGNQQSGGAGTFEMLTLTGETKTITISDASIITRQSMMGNGENRKALDGKANQSAASGVSSATGGNDTYSTNGTNNTNGNSNDKAASLTDITVGSILKVASETGTDKLDSVQILGAGNRGRTAESSSSSQP